MKQPELQPNEITLPLIQDSCAVKSPPNLVNMVENGETAQAKFTVSILSVIYICTQKTPNTRNRPVKNVFGKNTTQPSASVIRVAQN